MGACASSPPVPPVSTAAQGSPEPGSEVKRAPPPQPSYPTVLSRSAVPLDKPRPRPQELAQLAVDRDVAKFNNKFGDGTGEKALTYFTHLDAFPTNSRKQFDNVRCCSKTMFPQGVSQPLFSRAYCACFAPPPPPPRTLTPCRTHASVHTHVQLWGRGSADAVLEVLAAQTRTTSPGESSNESKDPNAVTP